MKQVRLMGILAVLALLALMTSAAAAQSNTKFTDGTFEVQAVPCAVVGKVADACAVGTATGDIRGDVVVTVNFTSFDPETFVQTYEGTIEIAKNKNHVFFGDIVDGTLVPSSATTLALNSTIVATGGTGIYEGIAGSLAVQGEIDTTTFTEVDSYAGELTFRADR